MKNLFNEKNIASTMAKGVKVVSTVGIDTRCTMIFHDVKKPEALKKLKKY